MAERIPEDVRSFIHQHLDSVSLLEVLLLLRRDSERWWPPDDVAAALTTRTGAAEGFLRHLHGEDLLEEREGRFRYAVPEKHRAAVESLADCYARRRHAIISVIFDQPDDAEESAARTLADAFRLRRRND